MAVAERPRTFAEQLLAVHHPLPWLPNRVEAEVYGSSRVRMGCPDLGEDLLHRYVPVFSGASPRGWTENDFLAGYRFEWALADVIACQACRLTDGLEFTKEGSKETSDGEQPEKRVLRHEWNGCCSVKGDSYFMALHLGETAASGKPAFRMCNCPGPSKRRAQIAGRQVDYR